MTIERMWLVVTGWGKVVAGADASLFTLDVATRIVEAALQDWGVSCEVMAVVPRGQFESAEEAVNSARFVMATHSRDWSVNGRDAWLWGIINGWDDPDEDPDDEAMAEIATAHGWDAVDVARLRRLHHGLNP